MLGKVSLRQLVGLIAKQSRRYAKNAALRRQLSESDKEVIAGHNALVRLFREGLVSTGNPITDAFLATYGVDSSTAEDVLEKVSRQFLHRVGQPALFVLHTQEGDENHCVLLLGVLNDKKFMVDGRAGICAPPFIKESSTADCSALDIRVVKGSSNILEEFSDISDITSKNLKCHIGIHQIVYYFRKYGGGTKGLITLYLMAKQIGIELPVSEIKELHQTLVDTLSVVLDVEGPFNEQPFGRRIFFCVAGEQQHIDV